MPGLCRILNSGSAPVCDNEPEDVCELMPQAQAASILVMHTEWEVS